VAKMKVRLLLTLYFVILSGCYDHFHGPSIRNGFGENVSITVIYADGETMRHDWPSCSETFIGKDIEIHSLRLSKGGRELYLLNREEIQQLIEKENSLDGYSVWEFSYDGIKLQTVPNIDCE
jgi:hypothetical protein